MFKFQKRLLNDNRPLKSGNFGDVFPYEEISGGQEWVVKRVLAKNINKLNSFLQEVVLGFGCDHPCVLTMKGYFIDQTEDTKYFHIYMKMPRMQMNLLDDLKSVQQLEKSYQEEEIIQHFYSLVCGIGYLHSKRIYHGDIKLDNLLLDSQRNLKVADIGIARHFQEDESFQTLSKKIGVPNYLAPEIFGDNVKNDSLPKADIWSIGVVILELCVADFRILNGSKSHVEIHAKINGYFQTLETKYPSSFSSLLGLLKRLLNVNPKERPEIEEIKSELEKSYSQYLAEDLLNFGKTASLQNSNKLEEKILLLNQQIQETTEKFESESRQLHKIIEKQEQEIKGVSEKNEKLAQIQSIQQEKISFQKDQEIELSAWNNRSMSENRIEMVESHQNIQERSRFQIMQVGANRSQNSSVESHSHSNPIARQNIEPEEERFSQDYSTNLANVVTQLNRKWRHQQFTARAMNQTLEILRRKQSSLSLKNSYFVNSGDMKDEHVLLLSKDILLDLHENNLVNLFGLRINFRNCNRLTEKAFSDFSRVISNKHLHLHHITLDFSECENFTEKAFSSFASALSEQAQYLQHLSLSLHACKKLKSLEGFQKIITKANFKPKHITLDFRNSIKLTDKALTNLATALSSTSIKSSLQQLILNFQACSQLTDQAFSTLVEALCHSPKQLPLTDLTLIFAGCTKLTNTAVTSLAQAIIKSSLHLKSLFLGLTECDKLTDKAISDLAGAISHQSLHLKQLTLNFAGCQELTDLAVLKLAKAISKQSPYLEHLSLSFDGCDKLTNHALENLASAISSQDPHLKHLTLIFHGIENLFRMSKLSDTGVEHLAKAIHSQKYLEELQLYFSEGLLGIGGSATSRKKENLRNQFAFISQVHIP